MSYLSSYRTGQLIGNIICSIGGSLLITLGTGSLAVGIGVLLIGIWLRPD